jgi:hypothetical protein
MSANEIKIELTNKVRNHEDFILQSVSYSTLHKVSGDVEYAEQELLEGLSEDNDNYEIINENWFKKLAVRQAKCNYFE